MKGHQVWYLHPVVAGASQINNSSNIGQRVGMHGVNTRIWCCAYTRFLNSPCTPRLCRKLTALLCQAKRSRRCAYSVSVACLTFKLRSEERHMSRQLFPGLPSLLDVSASPARTSVDLKMDISMPRTGFFQRIVFASPGAISWSLK